jgi:hypothetical protein
LYLVVEYVMALMVFGLEYSLHLNLVAIAWAWMPHAKIVTAPHPLGYYNLKVV